MLKNILSLNECVLMILNFDLNKISKYFKCFIVMGDNPVVIILILFFR